MARRNVASHSRAFWSHHGAAMDYLGYSEGRPDDQQRAGPKTSDCPCTRKENVETTFPLMSRLRLQDFDYSLPQGQIAQRPLPERDASRLMHVGRTSGLIAHHKVTDLPRLLPTGSLLIVNDSRVIPARLRARRVSGGRVELLLIERLDSGRWLSMLNSSKVLRQGELLALLSRDDVEHASARVLTPVEGGRAEVQLSDDARLDQLGTMPIPPYIRRAADAADAARYQTMFARTDGSVAAPTAGLHFTPRLMADLAGRDIEVRRVTLHVGPGTFVPVRTDDPAQHQMESERYHVSEATSEAIATAKRRGRAVVAVGTTVVRTLEGSGGRAGSGRTDLFIRPGHRFRVVDGLLTNFHLPRSTLLMLVCAFGGREAVIAAYVQAASEGYRFYSYGDAMLML